MSNKVAIGAAVALCLGYKGIQMLEQSCREAEGKEDKKRNDALDRERDAQIREQGEEAWTQKYQNIAKVEARLEMLAAAMLRELGALFAKKETEGAGLRLPFLKTAGAADSAGEVVYAVGLALGLDLVSLRARTGLDVFHEFPCDTGFAVSTLSRETLQDTVDFLRQYARRDRLGVPWSGAAICCQELVTNLVQLGLFRGDETDVQMRVVKVEGVEEQAVASLAGLLGYKTHLWSKVQQRPSKDDDVTEMLPRAHVCTQDPSAKGQFLLGNFELANGFVLARQPTNPSAYDLSSVASLHWVRSRKFLERKLIDPLPPQTKKVIDFCATLILNTLAKEAADRIEKELLDKTLGLYASDMGSRDGASIEHVVALSGNLDTLAQQPLHLMRMLTQWVIDNENEQLSGQIKTKLRNVLPLSAQEGKRAQEIDTFVLHYVKLLDLKLSAVPHLRDGRRPSQVVPPLSIREKGRSSLGIFVARTSQLRRCRHELEKDEKQRDVVTRTSGSVPLVFDVLGACTFGALIFWCVWCSVIYNAMWPITNLALGALGRSEFVEGKAFYGWMVAWCLVACYHLVLSLLKVPRTLGMLQLQAGSTDGEVLQRCRFACYSSLAVRLGWQLPLQRVLRPLEDASYAQIYRWVGDIARARYFELLRRSRHRPVSSKAAQRLLEDLCLSAERLRAERGCLPARSVQGAGVGGTVEAEAEANMALADGACLPGTVEDAEVFLQLEVDDAADSAEAGSASVEQEDSPTALLNDALREAVEDAHAASATSTSRVLADMVAHATSTRDVLAVVQVVYAKANQHAASRKHQQKLLAEQQRLCSAIASQPDPADRHAAPISSGDPDAGAADRERVAGTGGRGCALPTGAQKGHKRANAKTLRATLQERGWVFARRGRHMVFKRGAASGQHSQTQTFTLSCTPSDSRAYRNMAAQLDRMERDKEERDAEEAAAKANLEAVEMRMYAARREREEEEDGQGCGVGIEVGHCGEEVGGGGGKQQALEGKRAKKMKKLKEQEERERKFQEEREEEERRECVREKEQQAEEERRRKENELERKREEKERKEEERKAARERLQKERDEKAALELQARQRQQKEREEREALEMQESARARQRQDAEKAMRKLQKRKEWEEKAAREGARKEEEERVQHEEQARQRLEKQRRQEEAKARHQKAQAALLLASEEEARVRSEEEKERQRQLEAGMTLQEEAVARTCAETPSPLPSVLPPFPSSLQQCFEEERTEHSHTAHVREDASGGGKGRNGGADGGKGGGGAGRKERGGGAMERGAAEEGICEASVAEWLLEVLSGLLQHPDFIAQPVPVARLATELFKLHPPVKDWLTRTYGRGIQGIKAFVACPALRGHVDVMQTENGVRLLLK